MSEDILEPPRGLDEYAMQAWTALSADRPMPSEAELLALEAASRAWGRWKGLEERIAQMTGGNVLAGEVAKGRGDKLEKSALRAAADEAWHAFEKISNEWGFGRPNTDALVPSVDLFGVPLRERSGPGRPRFVATASDHQRVLLLLAMGWENKRIAETIGCSEPTFRREFKEELKIKDVARDRLDAKRMEVTFVEAMAGNMPAMKHLEALLEREDARAASNRFLPGDGATDEPEEKPRKLGAKEQRVVDAKAASSKFEQRFLEAKDAGEIKH